jgi:hypothetical protein
LIVSNNIPINFTILARFSFVVLSVADADLQRWIIEQKGELEKKKQELKDSSKYYNVIYNFYLYCALLNHVPLKARLYTCNRPASAAYLRPTCPSVERQPFYLITVYSRFLYVNFTVCLLMSHELCGTNFQSLG